MGRHVATVPFTLGDVAGELTLTAGDDLPDKVLQVCATHLDAARGVVGDMTAPADVVIIECGRHLLPAIVAGFYFPIPVPVD